MLRDYGGTGRPVYRRRMPPLVASPSWVVLASRFHGIVVERLVDGVTADRIRRGECDRHHGDEPRRGSAGCEGGCGHRRYGNVAEVVDATHPGDGAI